VTAEPVAAGTLSVASAPWLAGHVVLGVVVVPGTAVLDLVLDAARRVGAAGIGDLWISRPLLLPDSGEVRWRVLAGPLDRDGSRPVKVCVRRGADWVTHATGTLVDDPTADGRDGFVGTVDWPVRNLADVMDGLVPVRWRGVEVRPNAARARVTWDGDRGRVWLATEDGEPAGYVDEVLVAPLDVEAVRAEPVEHVYRMAYREIEVRASAHGRTVVDLTGATDPITTTLAALSHVQQERELVFLIDNNLACAPVRGLVRSVRAERPEWTVRIVVVDDASPAAVATALDADEPELIVRGSALLAARLTPASLTGGRPVLDPDGTALVTGGTGELGRLMAEHLVTGHGIRHLLLVSRRGPDAPGADELVVSLRAAGADTVRVLAADVADRGQVAAVLSAVDPRHPLTAVLHLAGVVDARLVTGQDATRFARVLAPKVDGARHLHELTRDEPLAAFVLFSSVASVFGSAGQSNYAAANAYLDALAEHRCANGLVATSVSWGLWVRTGMSSYLDDAEVARLRRQGVTALTPRQGRRIFDAAIAQDTPHLVAAVLTPPATVAREQLATLPDEERWHAVVSLVRREVAVVLSAGVGPRQVLGDAGVDSLMALELRTRLTAATSVPLPATLVVDHPTPNAIARLIVARLAPAPPRTPAIGVSGVAAGPSVPEAVWAALEHAGIVPGTLRDTRVGVFVGARDGDVATQVAQLFGLRGPAVTVCGSPLVAVHLARMVLLREECDLALAGGGDGMVVLSRAEARAVTDSVLDGIGAGGMSEIVAAVVERRRVEVIGSGARVTVEPRAALPVPAPPNTALPIVLSGQDRRALRRQAGRWADWLAARPEVSLAGVARTAALHRTHFAMRASVVASSPAAAVAALRAVAEGRPHTDVVESVAVRRNRLVFACPDHSGQCVAPVLLRDNAAFAWAATECDAVLRPLAGWSVLDVLAGDNDLDRTHPDVVRPALFTTQVSLAAALRALGFVPATAFGTVAADVIAGRCTLADGARMAVAGATASREPVTAHDEVVELRPSEGGAEELMRLLGAAHVHGYPVDWARALPAAGLVDLPPYPFAPADEPPDDPAGAIQWALRIMEFASTDLGRALNAALDDGVRP
jgi:short-subunit dehydrogenase